MRVGVVLNDFNQGGAERFVKDLVSRLEQRDEVEPRVIVFNEYGNLQTAFDAETIQYSSLDIDVAPCSIPTGVRELARALGDQDVDLVHSHLPFSHLTSRLAAAYLGRPHVATYHSVRENRTLPKSGVERATWRLSDRIICVSSGVRESYGDRPNMTVIYNAIDVGEFARTVSTAEQPAIGGVDEDTSLLLLNVGRCTSVKNQEALIHAVSLANRSGVHLVVVGDGPRRTDLEALARRESVADSITFTGYIERVEPYYARADAFVSSSRREGLPTTHIEAMAAELPVVSTDIPGVRELVTDGQTGKLFDPDDPSELATLIDALDRDDLEQLGKQGREKAQRECSLATVTDEHVRTYRSILS